MTNFITSLPGLLHFQCLIAYSMQKMEGEGLENLLT